MYYIVLYTFTLLVSLGILIGVKAEPACKYGKYDFSPLKGKSFAVRDGPNSYV